jgi:hypothetical protein
MRIIGATLTPFADSFKGSPFEGYYTTEKEKVRMAVNAWIRGSGGFDGVIDFDQVVKDPSRPTYIQAAYDKGDYLHPQDVRGAAGDRARRANVGLLGFRIMVPPQPETDPNASSCR